MRVEIPKNGASCHVGYKSCFYRKIKLEDNQNNVELEDLGHKKVFDPKKVYGDAPNPTKL
jgi:phosphoribosyl-AMP cyclohydrolase